MRNSEIIRHLDPDEKCMVDFIKRCLNVDPSKRMTCEEAIRHDWLKDLLISKEKIISGSQHN